MDKRMSKFPRMRSDFLREIADAIDAQRISLDVARDAVCKCVGADEGGVGKGMVDIVIGDVGIVGRVGVLGVYDLIFLMRLMSGESMEYCRTVNVARIPAYVGSDFYWFLALEGTTPKCWMLLVCTGDDEPKYCLSPYNGDLHYIFEVAADIKELEVVAGKRVMFDNTQESAVMKSMNEDELNTGLDAVELGRVL